MSVYAEYRNAKTDEEREQAKRDMAWENRRENYFESHRPILDGKYHFVETDNEYSVDDADTDDEEGDDEDGEE